ncbi:hypothetical protein GCM10023213_46480 [Prosthecobacter algae]|uniref:Uncharacterized protein n=1 Tax=Prosthecobacter algae TaxID=1144682 RepID=A0ABP9PQA1_9BACT
MLIRPHPSFLASLYLILAFVVPNNDLRGLDPFHSDADWKAYQKRMLEQRDHEKPVFRRPVPGSSQVTKIQTLPMSSFEVNKMPVTEALNLWANFCSKEGLRPSLFVSNEVTGKTVSLVCREKGQTAASVLKQLCDEAQMVVNISNEDFLIAFRDPTLKDRPTRYQLWLLSDSLHQHWFAKTKADPDQWHAVESDLERHGLIFPAGCYAEYLPNKRALLVVHYPVALSMLETRIEESEAEEMIKQLRDSQTTKIDEGGNSLQLKAFHLTKDQTKSLSKHLISAGKIQPFMASTQTVLKGYGLSTPLGSSAWLDSSKNCLWVLNSSVNIELCTRELSQWLKAADSFHQKPE